MLTELHLENLGVIESVDLVLGPGLTAITGETGAGKTMLVEALELVVGGRADAIVVRHGADEARVDARFVVGQREIVLSRAVPANGRSRAYLDGRPVTVAALAEEAAALVDLHGQHAHQRLLSPASQREALDLFGGVDLTPLRDARARVAELDAELAALGGDERSRARELDLARFQLTELDAAAIENPGEDEELSAEEDVLADASAHRLAAATAHEAVAGEGGARDATAAALAAVAGRAPLRELADRLAGLLADLDDLAADARDAADRIEEDPERLEAVRSRRQLLHDLRRKYGDDLEEVMRFHSAVAERVAELESFDERAARLDQARRDAIAAAEAAAAAVRAARAAAAPVLGRAITSALAGLAMSQAVVTVTVRPHGAGDDVEFLLAANPGTPPLPFAKIASGGELARTMLALRLVMVGHRSPDGSGGEPPTTLVFDEVDAGIGGTAATAVGRSLDEVSASHQVLVVTHLPQVAAVADTQISVVKTVVDGTTTATAAPVTGRARVEEIARMLSGELGGAAAQRHARELLSAR